MLPAGIVSGEGTGSTALLLDVNVMAEPPVGAALLNVTVSVTDAGPDTLAEESTAETMVGSVEVPTVAEAAELELL